MLQVASADGPDAVSGGVGGDYASFYAAGDVARDEPGSDSDVLYDPETQFAAQEPVLPSNADGNLYFAYPAFFVVPYMALTGLGFGASYLVHTALMAGALALALRLVRPMTEVVRTRPVEVYAAALTFFPLFRGVTGGQNTALSLLLIAMFWRGLHDGRDVPAGIAAGLLLFKPPLALPFLGALVLARRWRALAVALATTVALYAVGAAITDVGWPWRWVDSLRYLDRVDTPFNVQNFVSVPGAVEAVFGIDSLAATMIGFGVAGLAVVFISWAWWTDAGDLAGRIALTTAGALVISPHALFYDAGLLALVAIVFADRVPRVRPWLPALWFLGFAHLAADRLGVSPLSLLVVGAYAAALVWVRPATRTPRRTVPSAVEGGAGDHADVVSATGAECAETADQHGLWEGAEVVEGRRRRHRKSL